ncbi:hypothetical protein [Bythopirellula polymerisocia]|uniref:hypothetical protein n=1 Tax=Bythopirellula polymerisocia TaxID=2528003 RepID=UPI0018D3599F|nr:hypothetical protein [Bythopirellula polymerisocia]
MRNIAGFKNCGGLVPGRVERQQQFRRILEDAGVRVRFRNRKEDKIDAACGQ